MKLDETLLSRAAVLVRDRELQQLPDEKDCPEYVFSEKFEQEMQRLIEQVAKGEIQQNRVKWGWPYYARQGLAAVLICFLLVCFTMPEAVQAGCQRLVDVIETIVTEYTEYHYHSYALGNAEFVPLKIGYLPENLQLVEQDIGKRSYAVVFRDGEMYFTLEQIMLTEEDGMGYIVDTENSQTEKKKIGSYEVLLISKDKSYNYVWTYEEYFMTGQSNLKKDELIKILENINI